MLVTFSSFYNSILRYLCVTERDECAAVLLEYMDQGSLDKYLLENGTNLQVDQLSQIIFQVSLGMEYLHSQKILHRDLGTFSTNKITIKAARNVLLSGKGQDLIVKLSDFGMSKQMESEYYVSKDQEKLLPVKWTAIEVLTHAKFSFAVSLFIFFS